MKIILFFLLILLNNLSMAAPEEGEVAVSAYAFGGLMKWSTSNDRSTLESMSAPRLEVSVIYSCRANESKALRWPYVDCDTVPMASVRLSSYQWVRINNEEVLGRYLDPSSRSGYLYEKLSGHGEPLIEVGFNADDLRFTGYPAQELSFRLSSFDSFVASIKNEQFMKARSDVLGLRARYILTLLLVALVPFVFAWCAFKSARFFTENIDLL